MLLEGKVAIVSGIGPGMGRDISLRLASQGADIVLGGRTPAKLESVAKEVEALGRRATCVRTDITVPKDCKHIVESALTEHGGVDILVNNAYHGGTFTNFEDDNLETWRETVDVNLIGSMRLTKEVVPVMKKRGGGSIVMISTMATRVTSPGYAAYAASKAGLNAATQGLARELGQYQIRLNSVLPGYIWGKPVKEHFEAQAKQRGITPQDCYDEIASQIPLGRIPDSKEISGAVLFFASDLSSCITGQTLDVNGGMLMY